MEIFINELSLSGQYYDQKAFEEAIQEFMKIFTIVQSRQLAAYKNDNVFLEKDAIKNEPFSSSFERISNRQLKDAFRNIIFNKLNPKSWSRNQFHNIEDLFHCKTINDFVQNTSLAEVAERNIQDIDTVRILVNFTQSVFAHLKTLEVFKNDADEQFPIRLHCADNKSTFENYCPTIIEDLEAFLKTDSFRPTARVIKGARMYRNVRTNQYWYLDTFHKTHFEVFDDQEIHLGEADLNGILIPNTADKKKNGKIL
jgi:hypothetical protein